MISLRSFEHAMAQTGKAQVAVIEESIHLIRGQRVMLDSDLARFYGVPTKRLNEQIRRNRERFPEDFAFQLTRTESANLKSQIATSSLQIPETQASTNLISQNAISSMHGGRRKLPWVFTEHGAIMLASVLNSPVAVAASVRVVRAFVRLREMILANADLAAKFSELERRLDTHDEAIAQLFQAIRQLLEPPTLRPKREIGFHVAEKPPAYRTRKVSTRP